MDLENARIDIEHAREHILDRYRITKTEPEFEYLTGLLGAILELLEAAQRTVRRHKKGEFP